MLHFNALFTYIGFFVFVVSISYHLIHLHMVTPLVYSSMQDGEKKTYLVLTASSFKVEVHNSWENLCFHKHQKRSLNLIYNSLACATCYWELWVYIIDNSKKFRLFMQESIVSPGSETLAKKPQLVKLFRKLKSTPIRCHKKSPLVFFVRLYP